MESILSIIKSFLYGEDDINIFKKKKQSEQNKINMNIKKEKDGQSIMEIFEEIIE